MITTQFNFQKVENLNVGQKYLTLSQRLKSCNPRKWSPYLEDSVHAYIHSSFHEQIGQKCWCQGIGTIIRKSVLICLKFRLNLNQIPDFKSESNLLMALIFLTQFIVKNTFAI